MANVWVGDNYFIKSIYEKDTSRTYDNAAKNITSVRYFVKLQRLPESSYIYETEFFIDTHDDADLTVGLIDDALVAALLPKINTALSADDASAEADTYTPTDLDIYTLRI